MSTTRLVPMLLSYRGSIAVIILSLVLTIATIWWVGFDFENLSKGYVGDEGDTYLNSWVLYQAFDNLLYRPTDLGYSTIFYGEEDSLSYTVALYGLAVFCMPLYLITGQNIELTYNLYLIATFVLTAWSSYLLVRYLLNTSRTVAIVAALMFTFAPFRFLHLSHIETTSTQFFVLSLYSLHRLIDKPKLGWAIVFGIMFWFTAHTSGYLAVIFLVTGAIILLYYIWRQSSSSMYTEHGEERRFWSYFVFSIVLVVILSLPFIGFRLSNEELREGFTYQNAMEFSVRLDQIFSGYSYLYFHLVSFSGEATVFLGFTPLLLALGAWYHRRKAPETNPEHQGLTPREIIRVYAIITVVGFILMFGPVLRYGDNLIAPMPYLGLMQLPLISSLRVPARFVLMAVIGTTILSAYVLDLIVRNLAPRIQYAALLAVVACMLLEFTPVNGDRSYDFSTALERRLNGEVASYAPRIADPDQEPIYKWLAQQPQGTPVVHIPFYGASTFRYYSFQPYHNQPMLNGAGSFLPNFYGKYPWPYFPTPDIIDFVQERDIQYIIIHFDLMSEEERTLFYNQWMDYQQEYGEFELVTSFDEVEVYVVPGSTSMPE